MQLHGRLKRLISLASVLSVLREKNVAASLVHEVKPLSTGSEYSLTAKNVFQMFDGTDISKTKSIDHHLSESRANFDVLAEKIDTSINKGHYVHIEDGEADDYMQNIISILATGVVPEQVYLQGGHYKKRRAIAHMLWDYFVALFKIKKPEIFTISGRKDKFTPFDLAEGTGLLSDAQMAELTKEGNEKDYEQAVTEAQNKLRETLNNNDFTTIVLKTAPAGLPEVLKEFEDQQKVAIIWTGPIRKRAKTNAYERRFNYQQDPDAGDNLVKLKIPIVAVSPPLANSRLISIIDKVYMEKFKEFVKEIPVEASEEFKGFEDLARIKLNEEAKYSYYFFLLGDNFRDKKIAKYEIEKKSLDDRQQQIETDETLEHAVKEQKLTEIGNQRQSRLALGERWSELRKGNTEGKTFRELCALDQTASMVIDKSARVRSVQEVLQAELIPSENEVAVVPKLGGNTFIVSKFDSSWLEENIQKVITWMAEGEPKREVELSRAAQRELSWLEYLVSYLRFFKFRPQDWWRIMT